MQHKCDKGDMMRCTCQFGWILIKFKNLGKFSMWMDLNAGIEGATIWKPACRSSKMQYRRNKYLISKNKKERKNWQGHGSAHGEEIKRGAALWGQRERERWRKKEKRRENERERGRESLAVDYWADVPFLIPPVRGFVPWPSRKWELGRQQLTKELWRIQLAINGQPQAFVPVAMATAQHHYSKITKPFSTLLLLFPPSPLFAFSPCPFFFSFKVMSLFFSLVHLNRFFFFLFPRTRRSNIYVFFYT